jgi:hypothetical protein
MDMFIRSKCQGRLLVFLTEGFRLFDKPMFEANAFGFQRLVEKLLEFRF